MRHRNLRNQTDPGSRSGVTLTEVLMSLMIMSVGVSAVAVLFPISMLRSIQATQLTNGAITKYNVETLLDMHPELIFDPDGDYVAGPTAGALANLVEHFRVPAQRNYIVDPAGFYTHIADGNTGLAGTFGYDPTGFLTPFIPRHGGGLHVANGVNLAAATAAELRALQILGMTLAKQGDGWNMQLEALPAGLIGNGSGDVVGVQLNTDLDLTQIPTSNLLIPRNGGGAQIIPDPEVYRIVLFSETGQYTQSLPLTHIDTTTNQVFWSEDIDGDGTIDQDFNFNGIADVRPLPREFMVDTDGDLVPDTFTVSKVRLESNREHEFTWMLNVRRRSDGLARRIDVVVRFSNSIDPVDERLFPACFLPSPIGGTSRTVGVKIATDGTEPNIRRGKFIFDSLNGVWYRIQDVQDKPALATGTPWDTYDYIVTTETAIRAGEGAGSDALDDGVLNGSDTSSYSGAMFPPGIVDVYPMGSRNLPDDF